MLRSALALGTRAFDQGEPLLDALPQIVVDDP